MGQCTTRHYTVEQDSACMSASPIPEPAKKKKGRFFRGFFSRKSKKTTIEDQPSPCRTDSSQPPQRCFDGEVEQKSNTQSTSNCVSVLAAVEDVNEVIDTHSCNSTVLPLDEPEENSPVTSLTAVQGVKEDVLKAEENCDPDHTSVPSLESSLTPVQDNNEDIDKTEENCDPDHTSVSSPVSSLVVVQDNNEDIPKAEENCVIDNTSVPSPVSSLVVVQDVDIPRQEQGDIRTDNSASPTVPSMTAENNCTTSPSNDISWEIEDEIIHLSSKGKREDIALHYETGGMLGRGSYGNVFEGTRLSDSRKVALKYVPKTEAMKNVRLGLFGRSLPKEVAMMVLLSKGPNVPQIIKLLDWYETPDEYILVLERPTPCKDMRKFLLQHDGRISESTARVVMDQVVTAARICCERGVFHSDIKQENVLINENTLQIKLIDFGSSRRLKKSAYSKYNGTRVYAPPESIHLRKYHGKPATVYSLGVLLFKMLFGRYPGKQLPEICDRTIIIRHLSPLFFSECRELICSCLEKDPAKRIDLEKVLLHDWFQV